MTIVPPAEPASAHLPQSLLDGCPSCVVNTETPSSVYATDAGHLANYVCLDCGHAWSTSWGAE